MSAAVTTWSGDLRHYPNPQRQDRTLCGRRIDTEPPDTQADIDTLMWCTRCQKASTR